MWEGNAINTMKYSLWSQLEQIYFMTEFKNLNKTDLQVREEITLQPICVKSYLNKKAIVF